MRAERLVLGAASPSHTPRRLQRLLSLPPTLAARRGLAVTRSRGWIRSLTPEAAEPRRVGAESCREASCPLGIFSWHLCGRALKVAFGGRWASPAALGAFLPFLGSGHPPPLAAAGD